MSFLGEIWTWLWNWSVLCHWNQEFQKWGGAEPLDDLEDVTECAGCLDMEELGEILTGVGGGVYWHYWYATGRGQRGHEVDWCERRERIGWRLMIGRGGRLWGKQPKGSTRRVNPSNRQKLLVCTATRHQGAIEILWALYSEISLVGCPSFICSSVQDRLFII